MSTRNNSRWEIDAAPTTILPSCADRFEIWEPQPSGTFRASPGLYRDYLPLFAKCIIYLW
jgi:hypothetical protein